MLRTNILFTFLIAVLLQFGFSGASPIDSGLEIRSSHPCAVLVQRWYDNSFDVYDYGYAWSPTNQLYNNIGWVETANGLLQGQTAISTIGSHNLVVTNVANPAVVNGAVNWNDPGKLSFSWGTETWDSFSSGNPCTVKATGSAGARQGLPTETTCYFTCDSTGPGSPGS